MILTGRACHFGHLLQVSKTSLWKSDFIHFFHDFKHVYSPGAGAGADSPRGQSFDGNRNVLSLHSFGARLKKLSLKSDFILFFFLFFHDLIRVYSPEAGADSPQRTKLLCQQ